MKIFVMKKSFIQHDVKNKQLKEENKKLNENENDSENDNENDNENENENKILKKMKYLKMLTFKN